ncbi:hypothetical protein JX265_010510 [Neoarthrinium moseri]|uniref:Uncharacterized protein n=1 Tax=Neoarthrinium moseri TaxID=1658444 RepID=A0A9Q0ALK8_9PEZI|nr:hypothetical protein JX265_010510 [Neoarthrinium moseri]
MEVIGAVSSTITIFDLVQKLHRMYVTIKGAEKQWQRYCDGLKAVAHIEIVLQNILLKSADTRYLSIKVEGQQDEISLINHLKDVVLQLTNDANILVKRHNDLSKWKNVLVRLRKKAKLVLDLDTIASLVESVERAYNHLHIALTLASLHSSSSWQSKAGSLLSEIKADLAKYGPVLDRIDLSTKLRKKPLGLNMDDGASPGDEVSSFVEARETVVTPQNCSNQNKFRPGFTPQGLLRSKGKRRKALKAIVSTVRGSSSHVEDSPQLPQIEDSYDDGHDADNDSGDNDEPLHHGIASTINQHTLHNNLHQTEYTVISTERKLVQVPANSPMHQSATDPPDSQIYDDYPHLVSAAVRIEEVVESLSESEWEKAQHMDQEELTDFLTGAQPTAYATDAEKTDIEPHSPIIISPYRTSSVLIPPGTNLDVWETDMRFATRKFCIERVSILEDSQVFWAMNLCVDQCSPRCRHMTMNIENVSCIPSQEFSSQELPCKIQLAIFHVAEPSTNELPDNYSQQDDSVASFACNRSRTLAQGRCRKHTLIDEGDRVECAMPVRLFASPQVTPDDSDSGTERAPSEAEDHEDQPGHDEVRAKTAQSGGFPESPGPDDDEATFSVLRMIVLYHTYQPPRTIDFDVLMRFLCLADKYCQCARHRPIKQAKVWVSRMQPSETFDDNAVPWLWVLWKLNMGPQFQKLSSIIQRHARFSISIWQRGAGNKYGITLPLTILNQLDDRRLSVLSRIKDKMTSEMEKQRQIFSHCSSRESIFGVGDVLRSSFAFGYLKLESERWLMRQTPDQNGCSPDFGGVSFVDVKGQSLSMLEIGEWKICSVPLADKMPIPLAMLTSIIPVVGVGLHNEGLHVRLPEEIKAEFINFVEQIDGEDWGINLNQT